MFEIRKWASSAVNFPHKFGSHLSESDAGQLSLRVSFVLHHLAQIIAELASDARNLHSCPHRALRAHDVLATFAFLRG
jgi:hypothetical protein